MQLGCDARITGILSVWRGMDDYLVSVDRALCSQECPCRLDNPDEFRNNPNTVNAYNTWSILAENYAATAFQNCSSSVQANTLSRVLNTANTSGRYFPDSFDPSAFALYMQKIEREFMCTGWCKIIYYVPPTNTQITFSKYLFSDINR